jgi:hypothetical protein
MKKASMKGMKYRQQIRAIFKDHNNSCVCNISLKGELYIACSIEHWNYLKQTRNDSLHQKWQDPNYKIFTRPNGKVCYNTVPDTVLINDFKTMPRFITVPEVLKKYLTDGYVVDEVAAKLVKPIFDEHKYDQFKARQTKAKEIKEVPIQKPIQNHTWGNNENNK